MKYLITGAGGFLGRALCAGLTAQLGDHHFILADRAALSHTDPRAQCIQGDLHDAATVDAIVAGVDVIFHLAAVPGGAAETDYASSRSTNLQASLKLLERAALEPKPVRVVYASSIAVFGEPLPARIDDDTWPRPTLTYGVHKLMVCLALENLTRLGQIDGLALHLPGLVARPRSGAGMRTAFMSDVFHAMANRERYVLPVRGEATAWFMSVSRCVDNLLHAAAMPAPPAGTRRYFTLPAVRGSMHELVAALAARLGADPESITYEGDERLEAQFGRLPPLSTPLAQGLGFRSDGSIASLVQRALAAAGYR
jgi:nucleoside-diphosphate-sugar epimerase